MAAVQSQVDLKERLDRYREQLREAAVPLSNSAATGGARRRSSSLGEPASPGGEACGMTLESRKKCVKIRFQDAALRNLVIEGCMKDGDLVKKEWSKNERAREDARRKSKDLKNAIKKEEETHRTLHHELQQAFDAACEALNAASAEIDECAESAGEFAMEVEPADSIGGGVEASEEAQKAADAYAALMFQRQQEFNKRINLQEEIARLEAQLSSTNVRAKDKQKLVETESGLAKSEQAVAEAEWGLGLPHIHFDAARSMLILEGPDGDSQTEAMRTVVVEFDQEGRLTRATPHSDLGLQLAGEEAVRDNDLPRLLTYVWSNVCNFDSRRPSIGGA